MSNKYLSSASNKGVTFRELSAKSNRKIAQEAIREQITLIDSAITTAHCSGFNHVVHELPSNFNINNLDKKDAQTLIWSEILMTYKNPESLGGKGFESVRIEVGSRPLLHITWLNGMDDAERKRRKEFILACATR